MIKCLEVTGHGGSAENSRSRILERRCTGTMTRMASGSNRSLIMRPTVTSMPSRKSWLRRLIPPCRPRCADELDPPLYLQHEARSRSCSRSPLGRHQSPPQDSVGQIVIYMVDEGHGTLLDESEVDYYDPDAHLAFGQIAGTSAPERGRVPARARARGRVRGRERSSGGARGARRQGLGLPTGLMTKACSGKLVIHCKKFGYPMTTSHPNYVKWHGTL